MKIAFLSQHADMIGGGEYSLFDLLRGLPAAYVPLLIAPGAGELTRRAQAAGIEVQHLPLPPVGMQTPGALRAWRRWLKQQRPDLLHANGSRAALYGGLAAAGLKMPLIFHCRVNTADPRLDWLLARLTTRIVANSHATAARFAGLCPQRTVVVHNGIDMPATPMLHDHRIELGGGRMLLCVARLSRWKRHDLLIEAFADLAESLRDLQLVLVGGADPHDPGWENDLKQLALCFPCHERIHFVGHSDAMADWYRVAHLLLLPSRAEPFGRVVIEAMASGVPVIAANAGGPAEIITSGSNGLLIDDDTPNGWSTGMRRLLADAPLHAAIAAAGRRRASDFSLAAHVAKMVRLFDNVLAPEGSP